MRVFVGGEGWWSQFPWYYDVLEYTIIPEIEMEMYIVLYDLVYCNADVVYTML